MRLPHTIPEASDDNKLAEFGQDPANFDNKMLNQDDLWEEEINPHLKQVLGWGTEGNMEDLIWRGRKDVEGLATYVKYFVEDHGVNVVMPMFGSEPRFEPEPSWTGPGFGSRFNKLLNRTWGPGQGSEDGP